MPKPTSSTAPEHTGAAVPAPRTEPSDLAHPAVADLADHAGRGMDLVRRLATRLEGLVDELTEATAQAPSALPGWTRQHVLSHLARNADAVVNLLVWARTGIEHPMYPSRADRDADIEEGAHRLLQVIQEDLKAASGRLLHAAEQMVETSWEYPIIGAGGLRTPAAQVPWMRAQELLIHTADLDLAVDLADLVEVAGDEACAVLLDQSVSAYSTHADTPAVILEVALPAGGRRTVSFGSGTPAHLSGPAAAALGWLTGRTDASGLTGAAPELPAWL
jgi:maleylpyruvate isomerase